MRQDMHAFLTYDHINSFQLASIHKRHSTQAKLFRYSFYIWIVSAPEQMPSKSLAQSWHPADFYTFPSSISVCSIE
jgi:hypothetical protein